MANAKAFSLNFYAYICKRARELGSVTQAALELGVNRTTASKALVMEKAGKLKGATPAEDRHEQTATPHELLTADRERITHTTEAEQLKKKYAHAIKELSESERRVAAALGITQPVKPFKIEKNKSINGGQATAIVMASDWHVGERVDAHTINWLNEYNPDIAQARAQRFFANTLRLVRSARRDVTIEHLVLWMGGDLITGYIHDELEESNYMSPIEESIFAKSLFLGGLKLWKESGGFKRITVVTSFGNHGRTTMKRRISTGYKNSFEWMLYRDMASIYKDDEVVRFQVENGYFNYLNVYGRELRFHHGDNIKYGGGVGGLTIPLVKYIQRSNSQRKAAADFIGHYHQRMPFNPVHAFSVNSSLIGFNAYAQSIGASPEPPTQNFQLLDEKRGFTVAAPILVE